MEISVGDRGEVYVLRGGRLPYQVLNPDGTVEEVFVDRTATVVYEGEEGRTERVRSADYDEGYRNGWEEAMEEARDALWDISPPPRRQRPAPPAPPKVVTAAATGGRL